MAVRTYAQLISDISTYLTQKVTIVKHSALATNIVDTLFNSGNGSGARPYKVYTALLTQTGTDAPVATVLENTLGGTPVWSYSAVGDYTLTATGLLTSAKTTLTLNGANQFDGVGLTSTSFIYGLPNTIQFVSLDSAGAAVEWGNHPITGVLSIEIRVYP